jgi:hypothetical protein
MNGNHKEGLDAVDLPAPNGWKIPTVMNWTKELTVHVYSPMVFPMGEYLKAMMMMLNLK